MTSTFTDISELTHLLSQNIPLTTYTYGWSVPTSLVTQNSMYFLCYFQVKEMKSQVNLTLNHSVAVDNLDIT